MIRKITLTGIYRKTTDKDGKPLMGKNGKAYEKVSIKAAEYGNEFIGGFGGEWNKTWKEGDEITLDITKATFNGKEYLNFARVNMTERMMDMITELNTRVKALEEWRLKGFSYPVEKAEQPNFDPSDEPPIESFEEDADAVLASM